VAEEVSRFENACTASIAELDATIARVTQQIGDKEADIFRAHRFMTRDAALMAKVKRAILDRHVDAVTALRETLEEYSILFSEFRDGYLKERLADIRDVVQRILAQLNSRESRPHLDVSEPVVVVAPEILPSQVIAFDKLTVAGIITEAGGATGHSAILARSLGIPAVSGVSGILQEVETGDLVALDGRAGHVHLRPGPEVEAVYRELQREYASLSDRLIENRDEPPVSTDGIRIELLANVNTLTDATMAARVGADGIGLYRTEYFFLTHRGVPDEDEQLAVYRAIVEAAPNRTATIRTLDLGGDKSLDYLGNRDETNPSLGWRSTRLLSDHPEFFETQIRAILRAGLYGKVSLLFPMVSTLEEVQHLKRTVERTRAAMEQKKVPGGDRIPLGIMLEVPAAAMCIEDILHEVDFVSVGSNDLIQYLMAADRNNPKVARLCEPFSPVIFRLLQRIVQVCGDHGTPVTLCGEMAGRLRCFLPLFGMGLRRFSMSPAFIPPLKDLIKRMTQRIAQGIAEDVLRMKTAGAIRSYLTAEIRRIWPDAILLDTNA